MVKETNFQGKIVYTCEKCGWIYHRRKIAEECQEWCEKHKSCNLKLSKYAIKIK